MNSPHNTRFLSIGVVFSLIGVLIFGQMISIQNRPDMKNLQKKLKNNNNTITLKVIPERGAIYDRNRKLLAGSKEVYEIGIDLKSLTEETAENETEAIARCRVESHRRRLQPHARNDPRRPQHLPLMRLADGVDPTKVDQLRQMKQDD